MTGKIRNAPSIPDHEVLRKIGGGSYGEVWMARAVTGVMRAIKVVWRDDFDYDKDFEREFEGIHHYEPISRSHPGLIPILHVGRAHQEEEEFYYYVMELADDVLRGQEFHTVEYIPRTLRTDFKNADGTPLDVDDCLDLGVKMGEALDYLHGQGLAHRDVKPANVVFLNNEPKLADIGLVAMPGQRTFVGTEGFVPPEGPGTRRADIYSLGKVLYEMATGMDRLDFPNLPVYEYPSDKARRWHKLNTVICDVCNPREPHRNIKRARALVEALQRIQAGKKLKKKMGAKRKRALLLLPVLILLGWLGTSYFNRTENPVSQLSTMFIKEQAPVKILSSPSGAEVWTTGGEFLGTTPLAGRKEEVGTYQQYEFRLSGYSNTLVGAVVSTEGIVIEAELPVFAPPEEGEVWRDVLGLPYSPEDEIHISKQFTNRWATRRFLTSPAGKDIPHADANLPNGNVNHNVILMNQEGADKYCQWLTELCLQEGYLTEEFAISPILNPDAKFKDAPNWAKNQQLAPFQCKVERIPFGSLVIYTNISEEVTYYIDNKEVTPQAIPGAIIIPNLKPGKRKLMLTAEGYRKITKSIDLAEKEQKSLTLNLQPDRSVIFGKAWKNSLEIPLVPVGENLMVSVHETMVSAYRTYQEETKITAPPAPSFNQGDAHPVVNISREDAEAFCAWLTKKERRSSFISELHTYRLPTDREWSRFSGLAPEEGDTPSERDITSDQSFAWGMSWPPADEVGNLADGSLGLEVEYSANRIITGYEDHFPYTAPVGSFPIQTYGLYDLSGNVYEWVSDSFGLGDYGVTRGGSWKTYQEENLYRSFRNALKPGEKNAETGFRIVLSKE